MFKYNFSYHPRLLCPGSILLYMVEKMGYEKMGYDPSVQEAENDCLERVSVLRTLHRRCPIIYVHANPQAEYAVSKSWNEPICEVRERIGR